MMTQASSWQCGVLFWSGKEPDVLPGCKPSTSLLSSAPRLLLPLYMAELIDNNDAIVFWVAIFSSLRCLHAHTTPADMRHHQTCRWPGCSGCSGQLLRYEACCCWDVCKDSACQTPVGHHRLQLATGDL